MAMLMKAKEALIQKSAFSKPSIISLEPLVIPFGSAHIKIIKKVVVQVLMTQAATKAPD